MRFKIKANLFWGQNNSDRDRVSQRSVPFRNSTASKDMIIIDTKRSNVLFVKVRAASQSNDIRTFRLPSRTFLSWTKWHLVPVLGTITGSFRTRPASQILLKIHFFIDSNQRLLVQHQIPLQRNKRQHRAFKQIVDTDGKSPGAERTLHMSGSVENCSVVWNSKWSPTHFVTVVCHLKTTALNLHLLASLATKNIALEMFL